MRAEFEIYRKDITVKTRLGEQKFKLLPLSGKYYKKIMSVLKKFPQDENASNVDIMEALDEDTIGSLHKLCFETLKYSENVKDPKDLEKLDLYVSQNLFQIFPGVIEVNMVAPEE